MIRSLPPARLIALLAISTQITMLIATPCFGHGGVYVRPAPLGPMTGVSAEDAERFKAGTTPIGSLPGAGGPLARRASTNTLPRTPFENFWRTQGPSIIREFDRSYQANEPIAASKRGRGSAPRRIAVGWEPVKEAFAAAMASNDTDIVDSAILAQARCANRETAADALTSAWPLIAHPSETVRRSALLALGLVPDPQASPILRSFLHSPGRTDPVTNALAAISMGLRSDPGTLPDLIRALENKKAHPEVRTGAVIGLGLFQRDRRTAVAALRSALSDESLPETALLRVPIALARHGDSAAALSDELRQFIRGPQARWEVPCAIALGRLADPEDEAVRSTLIALGRHARDRETRGHAWLALARIAARETNRTTSTPAGSTDARASFNTSRSWLDTALRGAGSPGQKTEGPFIALALATAVSGDPQDRDRERVVKRLRDIASSKLPPDQRSAAMLGLGLLRDQDSFPLLLAAVRSPDPLISNRATTALGLTRNEMGGSALLARLRDRSLDVRARENAASALARVAPDRISDFLAKLTDDAKTITESVLACRLLGEHADTSAIPLLVRIAKDTDRESFTRAFAIVGLGRMLERTEIPWNQPVAIDADLRYMTGAEAAVLDIF